MAKNTQVSARNKDKEIQVSHSEIDSPVLDVNGLERLHNFRPDIVDFVLEETRKEAESRRKQEGRVNMFVFVERVGALLLASGLGAGGIFGSIYAAMHGFEKLAVAIAVTCIGSLAVAFLKRDK